MFKVRIARVAACALAMGAVVSSTATGMVQAAPSNNHNNNNNNNVEVCHRTHSVTNPYVRIVVDQRSVSNANSKHGGGAHDDWARSLYTSKPNPNVFDPSKTYPANDKKWGDIIAFKDVSGNNLIGAAANVAGLNNTGIGAQIFGGTGAFAGLCKKVNARDYYEIEKSAGIPPADILNEMNEIDSPDFATQLTACGGSFTGCDPSKLGTQSITIATTVAPGATTVPGATTAPGATTPTLPAGVTLAAGKGALQINVWVDADRNGSQASSEKSMKDITVKIAGPNGATKTAKTDANGVVLFTDLDPGAWSVVSTLSVDGYEKVYDSDGTVNWESSQTVVAGQVSAASFAAAPKAGTLPAGVTLTAGKGALQVKVWIDANRNGKKASSEKFMKNITVKIAGPNGATKTAKTGANGTVLFLDLDPGAWSVVSTLSVDGYEKVYDSDGTVNWKSNETVIAGQVAAASFAAATKPAAVSSDSLPATGSSSTPFAMIAGLFIMMGLVIVSSRKRQSL